MYTFFRSNYRNFSRTFQRVVKTVSPQRVEFFVYYNLGDIDRKLRELCVRRETPPLKDVLFLLQHDADVHAQNAYALRWASYFGHLEVVKILLSAGADAQTH